MAVKIKTNYEALNTMSDDKVNVLVMGNSGCGKSTLINAILEEEVAPTGMGKPVTQKLAVYQKAGLPFRMIDSIGLEYSYLKQKKIKQSLRAFMQSGIKEADHQKLVQVIWFCVDATQKRMDHQLLDYLRDVSKTWHYPPVIVVLTKSYVKKDRQEDVKMFNEVLANYPSKDRLNIKAVVPVVAKAYPLSQNEIVEPRNLDYLMKISNLVIPEAKRISQRAVKRLDLRMKKAMASSEIALAVTSSAVVGAVPITIPDAALLVPIQSAMLFGIAKVYKVPNKTLENEIIDTILKIGGTTFAGKTLLNTLKAIPVLNTAGVVLNAIVAGTITYIAGSVSVSIFEKAYAGKISLNAYDMDKEVESLFKKQLPKVVKKLENASLEGDGASILKNLLKILTKGSDKND